MPSKTVTKGVKVTTDPLPRFTVGDTEIHGVVSADIKMRVNEPVLLRLELLASKLAVSGEAEYWIADPVSGERKQLASLSFADGTVRPL